MLDWLDNSLWPCLLRSYIWSADMESSLPHLPGHGFPMSVWNAYIHEHNTWKLKQLLSELAVGGSVGPMAQLALRRNMIQGLKICPLVLDKRWLKKSPSGWSRMRSPVELQTVIVWVRSGRKFWVWRPTIGQMAWASLKAVGSATSS